MLFYDSSFVFKQTITVLFIFLPIIFIFFLPFVISLLDNNFWWCLGFSVSWIGSLLYYIIISSLFETLGIYN